MVWEADGSESGPVADLGIGSLSGPAFTTADRMTIGFTTAAGAAGDPHAKVLLRSEGREVTLGAGPSRLLALTADTAVYLAVSPNGGPVRVDLRTGAESNLHPAVTVGRSDLSLRATASQRYMIAATLGSTTEPFSGLYDLDQPRLIAPPGDLAQASILVVGGDVAWLQTSVGDVCANYFWRISTGAVSGAPGCYAQALLSGDGRTAVGLPVGAMTSVAFAVPPVPAPVAPSQRVCFAAVGDPGDVAVVNLTPVLAAGPGNGQLVSSDTTDPPTASNVNFASGTVDPNIALAPIGTDGNVCFVNSHHTTVHLIADQLATLDPTSATTTGNTRLADTRTGPPVGPNGRHCFAAAGEPGQIAVVNLTPVLAAGSGNGQLVPSDTTDPPTASNVNFASGTVDPNIALAPIGTDGKVCFVNSHHTTVHLIADQLATLDPTSATPVGARLLDTRTG